MGQPSQKEFLNFNAGVWGQKLDGRVDLEKYRYSLRDCTNMLLTPYGILERRPGTKYVANTKSNGAAILWPFQYNTTTGYIIEVGNLYMRFYKGALSESASQIQDTYDVDSDSITDEPYEITSPYTTADLYEIQFRQINDVVYITHEDYAPRKLIRLTVDTFSLSEVEFDLPAFRDENISAVTITPSGTTSSITLTASASTFTADNVGGYYRIAHRRDAVSVSKPLNVIGGAVSQAGTSSTIKILGDWNFRTTGRWAGTVVVQRQNVLTSAWETVRTFLCNDADRNVDVVGSEDTEVNMRINMTSWSDVTEEGSEDAYAYLEAGDAYSYGYAEVTAYSSATSVTATVVDDLAATTATEVWAESSWSPRRGYPRTCTLYEQRMFYAGNTNQPLTVWATNTGDFENFSYGVDDSDAFTYDLPSVEQNPIEWIEAHKAIIIGNGKEYGVLSSGSDDLPLTPSNAIYRVQESVGYANIKPEIIGDIMVGVERNGRRLREIAYAFDSGRSGGYIAADLNRLNPDLSESGIIEIDFAQLREPYIYAVMTDGTMGVLHYNRADGIVGWSKFVTDGSFESVSVIRGTDNDEVWVVVARTINGSSVRFIERFNPTTWSDQDDQYYVDCGVTYDGSAATTITGLSHLDGESCKILADGAVVSDGTPSGGQLTLDDSASVVHVGLGYTPIIRLPRIDMDSVVGNSMGHMKSIQEAYVRLYKSRGVKFSNNADGSDSDVLKLRQTTDVANEPYPDQTGEFRLDWESGFGDSFDLNDPPFVLTQDTPLPMSIVCVIIKYGIGK